MPSKKFILKNRTVIFLEKVHRLLVTIEMWKKNNRTIIFQFVD